MIRKVLPFIIILLLLSLQVLFHSIFGLVEALPDLIPVALAVAAIRWGITGAAIAGFLAGVVEDSFATSLLGLNSLSWTLAGTIGSTIRSSLYGNRIAVAVILVAVLKVIHEIVYYVVYLWNTPGEILTRIFLHIPIASIYSAGMALVIFILLDRLDLE
jgi:rod shape-determining protein MreD